MGGASSKNDASRSQQAALHTQKSKRVPACSRGFEGGACGAMSPGEVLVAVGLAALVAILAILFLDRLMSRNYAFSICACHTLMPFVRGALLGRRRERCW